MNERIQTASFTGQLQIGPMTFPCSVLSDGTRILTQSDFMNGMGMYYSGWIAKQRDKSEEPAGLPHFLAFKSLEPFVSKHLGDLQSITVKYRTKKGNIAHGIRAEIIPKICEIWLDAEEEGKLGSRQKQIASRARILMRGLAHVGIIALVDEATGYQEVRDRMALQAILEKYIRDEWAQWTKRFPDEFYKELFRLRGIPYPPENMKRPSYVGHWTNDIVYSRLAPGVLTALREKNPVTPRGHRKRRHHQFLTEDIGVPELRRHLENVIFLMKGCSDWDDFKRRLDRAAPKYGNTIPLDIGEA